ncbi:MAG: hypothetical protein GF405_09270 [Candidatus Eisenbacteria bacterium]|nr:hypothetical protein [Candidatus Eisenbacteria bacterium]
MLIRLALTALVLVLGPAAAPGQMYEAPFTDLVDLPTAHGLPRGGYSLSVRVAPGGDVVAGVRVGVTSYVGVGLTYGAGNAIGSGEPDWNDRVELDIKLRVADERQAIPAIAVGYDSRGYGAELDDGGYAKASEGLYIVATKTLPFSDFWQASVGASRTLEMKKVRPDFYAGLTARFSQEFSVVAEYHLGVDRLHDDDDSKTNYLNAGLRWVFNNQLELDVYFRNLIGPSDSPELSSRSLQFVFYDSF